MGLLLYDCIIDVVVFYVSEIVFVCRVNMLLRWTLCWLVHCCQFALEISGVHACTGMAGKCSQVSENSITGELSQNMPFYNLCIM